MTLTDRLRRLELCAEQSLIAGDLRVIGMQLARAEGKITRGQPDTRREQRIIEQRVIRAERRLDRVERAA